MKKSLQFIALIKLLPWYLGATVLYFGACATDPAARQGQGLSRNLFDGELGRFVLPGQFALAVSLFGLAVLTLVLGIVSTLEHVENLAKSQKK